MLWSNLFNFWWLQTFYNKISGWSWVSSSNSSALIDICHKDGAWWGILVPSDTCWNGTTQLRTQRHMKVAGSSRTVKLAMNFLQIFEGQLMADRLNLLFISLHSFIHPWNSAELWMHHQNKKSFLTIVLIVLVMRFASFRPEKELSLTKNRLRSTWWFATCLGCRGPTGMVGACVFRYNPWTVWMIEP